MMSSNEIGDDALGPLTAKVAYVAPALRSLGDLRDLTLGGSRGMPDSADDVNTLQE